MSKSYKIYPSGRKNDLKLQIEDEIKPLIQYIIKYFCFTDADLRREWLDEIYESYNILPKIDNTTYPDQKFMSKSFWEGNIDYYSIFYRVVIDDVNLDYGYDPVHNEDESKLFVISYLNWLAYNLVTYKAISKYDVKNFIDSQIKKFEG